MGTKTSPACFASILMRCELDRLLPCYSQFEWPWSTEKGGCTLPVRLDRFNAIALMTAGVFLVAYGCIRLPPTSGSAGGRGCPDRDALLASP